MPRQVPHDLASLPLQSVVEATRFEDSPQVWGCQVPPERLVTLCIVNYQGLQHLPKALIAANRSSLAFGEILVVDNASCVGCISWLRREYPDIRVLGLDANLGPAGARNAGFAAALHDLILFQDNDVQLDAKCAEALVETLAASAHALLVAPRVLYADDSALVQYDSADCHFLGLMTTRNANLPVRTLPTAALATTSLVTACFLIDRGRWSHGVLFDEWFGFNYEDHDFGVRANVQGYELLVAPVARAFHGSGTANLSYRSGGAVSKQRVFYLIRNRWCILTKSFAARSLLVLAPILACYELFQLAGAARNGWLDQWTAALRSWWNELPRLRVERRAVQGTRRTGDRLILKGGPLPLTVAVGTGRVPRLAIRLLQGLANGYWRLARRFL
jgi:GT2 family glycosyltransferase